MYCAYRFESGYAVIPWANTLSANRALQITKYILGESIGNYRFKSTLRQKAKTSGKSFMEPLALNDDENVRANRCGSFSCRRSRRVEISFALANEYADATRAMKQDSGSDNDFISLQGAAPRSLAATEQAAASSNRTN